MTMVVDPADYLVPVNSAPTQETRVMRNQQRPRSQGSKVSTVRRESQYPLHRVSTAPMGNNLRTRLPVSLLDFLREFVVR